jgi:hypothetical protein
MLVTASLVGLFFPTLASAQSVEQLLVDKARITFESFMTKPTRT